MTLQGHEPAQNRGWLINHRCLQYSARAGQGTSGPAMPRYLRAARSGDAYRTAGLRAHLHREHMNLDATVSRCPTQQLRRLIRPHRNVATTFRWPARSPPEFQQVLPAVFFRAAGRASRQPRRLARHRNDGPARLPGATRSPHRPLIPRTRGPRGGPLSGQCGADDGDDGDQAERGLCVTSHRSPSSARHQMATVAASLPTISAATCAPVVRRRQLRCVTQSWTQRDARSPNRNIY